MELNITCCTGCILLNIGVFGETLTCKIDDKDVSDFVKMRIMPPSCMLHSEELRIKKFNLGEQIHAKERPDARSTNTDTNDEKTRKVCPEKGC